VANLAAALVKAQAKLKPAIKDSANPFFKSKYADLGAVWEACREALQSEGLAVVQLPGFASGEARLTTILLHASGEWIAGEAGAPLAKADAQGVGSAITYLRRYGLAAVAGVVTEDDDGNSASGNAPVRPASASRGRGATGQPPTGDRAKSPLQTPQVHGANPDLSKMPEVLTKPEDPLPWQVASAIKANMLRAAALKASIKGADFPDWYETVLGRAYDGKLYDQDIGPLMESIVKRNTLLSGNRAGPAAAGPAKEAPRPVESAPSSVPQTAGPQ
jgi:hypothetical protein